MAAIISGSMTVTTNVSTDWTAAKITALFATPPEDITVADWQNFASIVSAKQMLGASPTAKLGTLFP